MTTDSPGATNEQKRYTRPALVCVLLSFGVYFYTLAPGATFGEDGPMFQTLAWEGHVSIAAYAHALYAMIAYVMARIPIGETVAWRINVLSAISASAAIGVLMACTPRWLRAFGTSADRVVPYSILGVGLLATNHTLWWHATTAEVYSLSVVFMAVALYLIIAFETSRQLRYAAGLLFVVCLGATQHLQVTFFILWWLPWTLWRVRAVCGLTGRNFGALVIAAAIGSLPYAALFAYDWLVHWRSLPLSMYFALGGPFLAWMAPPVSAWSWVARNTASSILWDITPWGLALGFWGMRVAWRSNRALFGWLVPAAVLTFAQGAAYPVLDQQVFYLPFAAVLVPLICLGMADVSQSWRTSRAQLTVCVMVLAPFLINWNLPQAHSRIEWDRLQRRRPNITHPIMSPNMRGLTWPDDWAKSALNEADPNARILASTFADLRGGIILQYQQIVEGLRPDVEISGFYGESSGALDFEELFEAEVDTRPIYLSTFSVAAYRMNELDKRFDFTDEGPIVRVTRKANVPAWNRGPELPCVGEWTGQGAGIGHAVRLTVRSWEQGLVCWVHADMRNSTSRSESAAGRLNFSLTNVAWDPDTQTLTGTSPYVFGLPFELTAVIDGETMTGKWTVGVPTKASGSWTARRETTAPD